ncbi:unnamed protein product [Auanema sp. JU1783]|nr:unnamed protein product [Auanema sp. JU1783]
MMSASIFSCLLFIHYINAQSYFDPLIFYGRPKLGTLYQPYSSAESDNQGETVTNGFFPQKLDHFSDPSETWGQHYYHRRMQNSQLAFLVLGGNGDITRDWFISSDSPYVRWAEDHRAQLFGLEHRFYGQSKAVRNISTANLKYLSIAQAMKDVESFINWQVSNRRVPETHKWILFGGSYAASLALWLRQTNPKLIFGVVASSAPIQAKLDAYEYNMVVENFFDKNSACKACVQKIFDYVVSEMYTTATRESLETDLSLKLLYSKKEVSVGYTDTQFLFWTLQQPLQLLTQYYKTGSRFDSLNMTGFCTDLVCPAGNDSLKPALVKFYELIKEMYQEYYAVTITKLDNDYQNAVDTLKLEDNNSTDYDYQHRLWLWQLCNELGYSMTTDYGISSLFDSTVSPSLFITMCKDVFDINLAGIIKGIENTNNMFGGITGYTGTNAVLTSATYDTFKYFTKTHATDKSVRILTISDAGHASDVYPTTDSNIRDTQNKISSEIRRMLTADIDPPAEASTELPWNVEFRVKKPSTSVLLPRNDTTKSSFGRSKLSVVTHKLSQVFFGRPPFGFTPSPQWVESDEPPLDFLYGAVNQHIDHANEDSTYFRQSYCRNGEYQTDDGPVYLVIGGDSAIDCNWIKDNSSTIVQMAKENGAVMYFLEHRFFGSSVISGKPTFDDLKYLTITQAVNDIGSFVATAMNDNRIEKSKPWIALGSSYAGTLAALARASFPELIAGAIASSAILNPQFSYMENSIQADNIIQTSNKACADTLKGVFTELRTDLLSKPDALKPSETNFPEFADWDLKNLPDQQYFFLNLYSSILGALFFDKVDSLVDFTPQLTDLCTTVKDVAGLSAYYTDTNSLYQNGKTLTRDQVIDVIQKIYEVDNTKEDKATVNWIWLSCNQLASFPTTDAGDGIFGSPTPVDFFINFCKDTFGTLLNAGYNSLLMENEIRVVDYLLGTIEKSLGNVAITSGSLDPRLSLTIPQITVNTDTVDKSTSAIDYTLLNGTSHAALFYPASAKDSTELTNARKKITDELRNWQPAPPPVTYAPRTSTRTPNSNVTRGPNVETSTKSAVTIGRYMISVILFVLIL